MFLYSSKGLFTIWAKRVGTQNNTEQHRNGRFAPDTEIDEKNNPNYLVCKNNCVPLRHE